MASLPEFTWIPDLGALPTRTPIVSQIKFGDGYELRVGESLNRVRTSWELTFTRPAEEIIAIDDFLTARGGLEAFRWKTPIKKDGAYVERSFVCREWQGPSQQERGLYVISATFDEVFEN